MLRPGRGRDAMTRYTVVATMLGIGTVASVWHGSTVLSRLQARVPASPASVVTSPSLEPEWTVDSLAEWGDRIVLRNLFRATRTSGAAMEPDGMIPLMSPVTTPLVMPPLSAPTLQGVVGGSGGWEAIVAGLPGRESGVLVRLDDRIGDLHVREVGPSSIVLQGPDSSWRLTLRTPRP